MNFDYSVKQFDRASLTLDYFDVPWDTEILGRRVAEIATLSVRDSKAAAGEFREFSDQLEQRHIFLCSARLPHDALAEIDLLQQYDFRFIELNYRPEYRDLHLAELEADTVVIESAAPEDADYLVELCGRIFEHGRFHQDIRLGRDVGNRRYRTWMQNAFKLPTQHVLKCSINGSVAAFFVVEYADGGHCHWSLVGMVPEYAGRGLARRVWTALMDWHRREGIRSLSTSISSHNAAVFNLYVRLGFRFPTPSVTLHWVAPGS